MSDRWVWPKFIGGPAHGQEISGKDTGRGWIQVANLHAQGGSDWYWPVSLVLVNTRVSAIEAPILMGYMHADLSREKGTAMLFEELLSTSACVPLDRDPPDTKD